MRVSLAPRALAGYLAGQLNAFFPDGHPVAVDDLLPHLDAILARVERCFARIANKYFCDGGEAVFSHLHGDQYAMFLYLAANSLWRAGRPPGLCAKLFLLNKALHGLDAFYEVELPAVFLFVHPLGTVLGRGSYGDYFCVYQRCGIGSNHDVYPTLGQGVTLRPGASVLGRCQVGDDCTIAAESLLLDRDLPAGSLYIGNPRDCSERPGAVRPAIWRLP